MVRVLQLEDHLPNSIPEQKRQKDNLLASGRISIGTQASCIQDISQCPPVQVPQVPKVKIRSKSLMYLYHQVQREGNILTGYFQILQLKAEYRASGQWKPLP